MIAPVRRWIYSAQCCMTISHATPNWSTRSVKTTVEGNRLNKSDSSAREYTFMKKLLILGSGTAGTMVANRMRRLLDADDWSITIVDQHATHYYQPGFLFIPFGMYSKNDVIKPKRDFIPAGVELILSPIEVIEPDHNRVKLVK